MRAHRLRVALAYAAVYLGWGSTYLAIRYGIASFPPLLMQGTRFLLAGGLLYAWQRRRGARRPTVPEWRAAAVVGVLLPACGSGGVAWAEQFVPSGLAAVLIATEALWIVLLLWLMGRQRPSGPLLLGVVLGCSGVALLALPHGLPGHTIPPAGVAVLLGAALAWGIGSIYSWGARVHPSGQMAAAMSLLAAGVLLVVVGVIAGEPARFDPVRVTSASVLAFIYLTVVGSLLAFTAYLWLTRVTTPVRASTYAFVNPVVALLLGWLVGGEALSLSAAAAAAVIVVAVVLVVWHPPTARHTRVSGGGGRARTPTPLRVTALTVRGPGESVVESATGHEQEGGRECRIAS